MKKPCYLIIPFRPRIKQKTCTVCNHDFPFHCELDLYDMLYVCKYMHFVYMVVSSYAVPFELYNFKENYKLIRKYASKRLSEVSLIIGAFSL